ncbi:CmcJ/NvfI family oxidoreductase [Dongia sp.]|uniref:CmcJ/NvfI family oxidoreductase n=1 Tax=Dongia sp. TaxID=1977262 RepID=UPI003751DC65
MLQQKAKAPAVQNAPLGGVEGELSFIIPDGKKPFSHQYDPPPGQPVRSHQYENRKVFIQDGRPQADAFSIDREGFALVRHTTEVADLYDEVALKQAYYPETEALLKAETGASKLVIFDHTIRTSHNRPRGVGLPREAVLRVHNDYTLKSGPQRVRDLVPEEAEARLRKRFAIVNVWRPIVGPLQQFPLALGDAESLAAKDVLATDLIYPDRVGEIYSIAYNPSQRWFYFPEMSRDEAVLIKTYDSDPARARFSAHGAFADPNFPDPKVLRESIEIRALVFFD